MKKLVAVLVVLSLTSFACYNTYYVSMDQLKELQSADEGTNKVVTTKEGKAVEVNQGTRLFVRDTDGKKYPITPYNFKVTRSQLVASDRDYIFMKNQLTENGEVELLSTWKTVGIISAAAAAVVGLIVVTVVSAGQKTFSSGE